MAFAQQKLGGKEMSLSYKRKEIFELFKSKEYQAVTFSVLSAVERQDKETVRLLKAFNMTTGTHSKRDWQDAIDNIFGKELTSHN